MGHNKENIFLVNKIDIMLYSWVEIQNSSRLVAISFTKNSLELIL